ncbi:kinase-like protein [Teratosphaeria nubilosa]|uniref:non-specific serine/threonine protein kinase n=1 Tax=Teratosphaeria nubilosa TaxID=161662 RepID=A0A6G1L8D7_9PEZI|nr:kinase-like protein [Teratosphaeria nubilosa]
MSFKQMPSLLHYRRVWNEIRLAKPAAQPTRLLIESSEMASCLPVAWQKYFDDTLPAAPPAPAIGPTPAAIAAWANMHPHLQQGFVSCHAQVQEANSEVADARTAIASAQAHIDALQNANPRRWDQYTAAARRRSSCALALLDSLDHLIDVITEFRDFPATLNGAAWDVVIAQRINKELNWVLELQRNEAPIHRNDASLWTERACNPPVPDDPATHVRKIPRHYLPSFARRRQFRRASLPAAVTDPSTAHRWLGTWMIGNGGMSNTGLFVGLSIEDKVVDRAFVKQCDLSSFWTDAIYWEGNVKVPTARTTMEVACQLEMQRIPNRKSNGPMVPELRHWTIDNAAKESVMYMSYCGRGSLAELIEAYDHRDGRIPEPFLWCCFLTLAEACLAMETGHQNATVAPPAPPITNWHQIIHRDIKLSNIFLDTENKNWFPSYPAPKLGDFGLAIRTTSKDALNPGAYNAGAGTLGYYAPEVRLYVDLNLGLQPTAQFKILSPANIWAVGRIMACLVSYETDPPQLDYMGDGTDPTTVPNVATMNKSKSSATLVNLEQTCLEYDPANRPTPGQLIADIDKSIHTGRVPDGGLASGMQHPNHPLMWDDSWWAAQALEMPSDAYRFGLALGDLPEQGY